MKKDIELKYLKQVLMLVPGNVYWKDREGRYLGCNYQQLQVARVESLEEIIGKTDKELYSNEIATRVIKTDKEIIEKRLDKTLEEVSIDSEGRETIYLTKKSPLYDELGHVVGLVGIGVDITEKKKAEQAIIQAKEAAEAANHAKTEFLENMRHDVRTPLTGIVGCAQIIKSEANDPEKVAEYAEDLIQSSDALLEFMNRVLEAVNVATGEIPLLKKKFDLYKELQNIINLNQSLAASKHIELTLNYDEKIPPYLIGAPVRLQRIVLELVTNALTFTQQGKISVAAQLKKQEAQQVVIEITVSDTGIGIPLDKQEEIFIRFKRLTPSYKGIYKGLGIGLALVKQFIDDLSGEIYVTSQPNQGTTFTCLIPLQKPLIMDNVGVEEIPLGIASKPYPKTADIRVDTSQNDSLLSANSRHILLVEDDRLAAKVVQAILSDLNCQIDVASDAKTALQRLQEHAYHLIFMDIGLPDMDGISLTHRIRLQQWQRSHATPIIGLTAHIDAEKRQQCLDAGMNTVILQHFHKC